eukprot:2903044-Prymnesium_polylepis.1
MDGESVSHSQHGTSELFAARASGGSLSSAHSSARGHAVLQSAPQRTAAYSVERWCDLCTVHFLLLSYRASEQTDLLLHGSCCTAAAGSRVTDLNLHSPYCIRNSYGSYHNINEEGTALYHVEAQRTKTSTTAASTKA